MNNTTRNMLLALVAITGAALAQQITQKLALTINGKNSSDKAVILGGKTYYIGFKNVGCDHQTHRKQNCADQ